MQRAIRLALIIWGLSLNQARAQEDPQKLAAQVQSLLREHCHKCHNGPGSESGYDFDVLKVASLTQKTEEGNPVIKPKNPAKESRLYRIVERGKMPPGKKLAAEELTLLGKWITAGAPDFPRVQQRPFLALRDILQAIDTHLQDAPKEQRPYLRYFTLVNIYNNPKIPDEDLQVYRAALTKAVNSMSWHPRMARLHPVDAWQTTYALDLRHVRWDAHAWRKVLTYYPYGLKYESHKDKKLQALDHRLRQETGADLPYLRADWFITVATQPPLYHDLLRMPHTAQELEHKLDVNIKDNFLSDMLMRSGFKKSNVSNQNRLVERHDAAYGAYWISYDFKPKNAHGDLLQFPLGPRDLFPHGQHPYEREAFTHDGGEIIFNLPNGLQGYLLTDSKGGRLDEPAPDDVVQESSRFLGTARVINGISCMHCHAKGMIPLRDDVREGFAKLGDAQQKVERLYPARSVMNKQIVEDQDRFLRALRKAFASVGVSFEKDADFHKFIEGREPVGKVADIYLTHSLDLAMVAQELDLPAPTKLLEKIGENRLRQLGLGSLMQEGGIITRQDWDTVKARSLMQRAAEELGATSVKVTQ
jgi:serine/threonine-protein kinase